VPQFRQLHDLQCSSSAGSILILVNSWTDSFGDSKVKEPIHSRFCFNILTCFLYFLIWLLQSAVYFCVVSLQPSAFVYSFFWFFDSELSPKTRLRFLSKHFLGGGRLRIAHTQFFVNQPSTMQLPQPCLHPWSVPGLPEEPRWLFENRQDNAKLVVGRIYRAGLLLRDTTFGSEKYWKQITINWGTLHLSHLCDTGPYIAIGGNGDHIMTIPFLSSFCAYDVSLSFPRCTLFCAPVQISQNPCMLTRSDWHWWLRTEDWPTAFLFFPYSSPAS
jgi:hypothetical protein